MFASRLLTIRRLGFGSVRNPLFAKLHPVRNPLFTKLHTGVAARVSRATFATDSSPSVVAFRRSGALLRTRGKLLGPTRRRLLSTAKNEEPVDRIKEMARYLTPGHFRMYAAIAASGFAVYAILKTGYHTASFFSSITIYDGLKVGFVLGCICGGIVVTLVSVTSGRFFRLRPETVYRSMLLAVQNDPTVLKKLGSPIRPLSEFKAYTYVPGGIRTDPDERAKYTGFFTKWYRPTRLQIMFTVKGDKGNGVVSAEVEGSLTSPFYYVHKALDVLDTEEHIVLQGREDKMVYQGRVHLR